MKVTIVRKDVGPKNLVLRVIMTDENKYPGKQFKIDVWSDPDKTYWMRLEGFGCRLHLWQARTLGTLLKRLKAYSDKFEVVADEYTRYEVCKYFFNEVRKAVIQELDSEP
jgi:hypothetical protein